MKKSKIIMFMLICAICTIIGFNCTFTDSPTGPDDDTTEISQTEIYSE